MTTMGKEKKTHCFRYIFSIKSSKQILNNSVLYFQVRKILEVFLQKILLFFFPLPYVIELVITEDEHPFVHSSIINPNDETCPYIVTHDFIGLYEIVNLMLFKAIEIESLGFGKPFEFHYIGHTIMEAIAIIGFGIKTRIRYFVHPAIL